MNPVTDRYRLRLVAVITAIIALVALSTPVAAAGFDYSSYTADTLNETVLVNVTGTGYVPETGFIPWQIWIMFPVIGFVFLILSIYLRDYPEIPAIISVLSFFLAAGYATMLEMYTEHVELVTSQTGDLIALIIPVSHPLPYVPVMIFMIGMAVVAMINLLRAVFVTAEDRAKRADEAIQSDTIPWRGKI